MESTLAILKPDSVQKKSIGRILARIEEAGFKIAAIKMIRLDRTIAGKFYEIHKERPFFGELMDFMTEGPVVVAILEKEQAVAAWRSLMGATDPKKAEAGTIRRDFADDVSRNMVHGSDSLENAAREIRFFFSESEYYAVNQ
jgi:nucleoside-diphosphate kinase